MDDAYTQQLQDDGVALWVAQLSDGSVATMDDGRPWADPPSGWERLGARCRREGIYIRRMWLKFRSNVCRGILPDDAAGYFFAKKLLRDIDATHQQFFYLVGHLTGDKVVVQQYLVPELVLVQVEERVADYSSPCLISRRALGEDRPGLGRPPA